MGNVETVTPAGSLAAPPSLLSPAGFYLLLLKPARFFSDARRLDRKPEVALVAWLSGIEYALGRVKTSIFKAELGRPMGGWGTLGPWLSESWIHLWAFILGTGAINAVVLWYLGGWWYRKRLAWSGATGVDARLPRVVYVYQDLVYSVPVLLVLVMQTLLFASYREARSADEIWSLSTLIFAFWSTVTSYKAAVTAFPVSRSKALVWFLVLPVVVYVIVLGAFGTLYALIIHLRSAPS